MLKSAGVLILCVAFAASQECFNINGTEGSRLKSAKDLSAGSADFGIALFKNVVAKTLNPKDNVFISPISVWSALTMTYLGSRGKTEQEMATALHFGDSDYTAVASSYRELKDKNLVHEATGAANYTFRLANKLYFEKTVPIQQTCINEHLLKAEIEKVDFVNAPQPSRVLINDWVANQTNDKIKDLLPPDYITPATTMVIVNAAYFIGYWHKQFNPKGTQSDQDFFAQPGQPIKVKMMNLESFFRFDKSNAELDSSAIEMPYSGEEVSMVILLPHENASVDTILSKLTAESFNKLYEGMQPENVQVSLPKFRIEQTFELKEAVQQLGIHDLFDPSLADLSGFTDQKGNYVNFIRHKTFIDVNEGGTEAAAATAVGVTKLSAIVPNRREQFIVNRPFFIFLRNNKLGTIFFMGLIKEPKQQ